MGEELSFSASPFLGETFEKPEWMEEGRVVQEGGGEKVRGKNLFTALYATTGEEEEVVHL